MWLDRCCMFVLVNLFVQCLSASVTSNEDDDVYRAQQLLQQTQRGRVTVLTGEEAHTLIAEDSDDRTVVYVKAEVLDLENRLYFLPSNNSNEGWVFWKVPHRCARLPMW